LQASLSESLTLRQQNESAVNAMNEQLQQRITIAAWLYEDSRLLRDDINTLFATEHMTNVLLEGPGGRWSVSTRSLWSIWFREMKPNVPAVFCNSSGCARV
jgi:hypothetical protein